MLTTSACFAINEGALEEAPMEPLKLSSMPLDSPEDAVQGSAIDVGIKPGHETWARGSMLILDSVCRLWASIQTECLPYNRSLRHEEDRWKAPSVPLNRAEPAILISGVPRDAGSAQEV